MQSPRRSTLRQKAGLQIGPKVRELRLSRRWTQAELAGRLGLSQARLSEVERGDGSFTAEQFLEILRLFNVHVSHFAPQSTSAADVDLQNALARLGAAHLSEHESLPSDRVVRASEAIREALVLGSARFVTALGPVLVRNTRSIQLARIEASLREVGLEHRLGWLLDNVLEAIHEDLALGKPPAELRRRYHRAALLVETHQEAARARAHRRPASDSDILDEDIRSKQTLAEVRAASSPISRRWNIVSRLQPGDFLEALQAARAAA
jgi:transcriptional regulator with XRE-family HTH domain